MITAADVVSVERAMIRLRLDDDGHLAWAFDVVGGASPASSTGRGVGTAVDLVRCGSLVRYDVHRTITSIRRSVAASPSVEAPLAIGIGSVGSHEQALLSWLAVMVSRLGCG